MATAGCARGTAAADSTPSTDCSATGKQAVIVGAGPAGALAAMLLARQGFKVDVFERLAPLVDEQGKVQASIGPRSYNILLTERAVAAIEEAGADLRFFDVPDSTYNMRHMLRGGPREGHLSTNPGRLKIANRGTLAGVLVQQCLAQHGDAVQFHFEQELHLIDTVNGIVFFHPIGSAAEGTALTSGSMGSGGGDDCSGGEAGGAGADGSTIAAAGSGAALRQAPPAALMLQRTPASTDALVSYTYDLLVGADGSSSLVRQLLERYDTDLRVGVTRDTMEFRTCVLGRADEFLPEGLDAVGTFQTWSNSKLQATLVGSSTRNGQLRCAFILPEGVHATLKTVADCVKYMADAFPSLPQDAIKRAAPQLVESPISNGGIIVRCSKLNSGRVVLVGDAAHSVYPSLGQGANAALEGAATLGAVLQELGAQDIEAAAAEYSRRWLPNALAVADLTEEAFGKNARALAPNRKLVQMLSQLLLHKLLPFLVPKPALFQLNSTTIPYATILKRSKQEMLAFNAVLAAVTAAALTFLARNFARPAVAALGLL